jgi:LmbE family N-acetylglucosaminyl deacetylase
MLTAGREPLARVTPAPPQVPPGRLLSWLRNGAADPVLSTMIVAAHPDDEVIGAGAQLRGLPGLILLHVTDGAPRNLQDAAAAGFSGWEAYASARRDELAAALRLAGISSGAARTLGIPDQGASFQMVELAEALAATFEGFRPDVVITHPYEGGHPDHDATALAVHGACALLQRQGLEPPSLLEMTSYHAGGDGLVASSFLPRPGAEVTTLVLDRAARTLKQQLFACFATQQSVLAGFPIAVERFRPAPSYDFERPPHEGQLYYEGFDWGLDGTRWRALAREALPVLGLSGAP